MKNTYMAWCETCKRSFDLRKIHFVDYDYYPMVLSVQIDGRASKRKAIEYLKTKHDAYEPDAFEDDAIFSYRGATPNLSHSEPGDDAHALTNFKTGYWSFEP